MASAILAALEAQVKATTDVEASAVLALDGVAARIQIAVDAAVANGATSEELAPVQAEVDALKASSDSLAAAVAANTGPQA
jgi:hypothetical protein